MKPGIWIAAVNAPQAQQNKVGSGKI